MLRRGIILLLLATLLAGNVLCNAPDDVTTIPASQDVYISMGANRVSVYNQTEMLLCAVDVTDGNKTEISYPGAPVVQFNISSLNITDNDVAVLVLKAASMQKQKDPIMVALMSIGSDWDESSDYTTFLVNILPAWNIIKKNDATAMSSNTDGDSIFAFDVSQKLRDARAEGDKISFLLEAISNSSSEISFLPRETGQGPCLVIMPYPVSTPDVTMQPDSTQPLNSSLPPDQTTILSENMNQTEQQTDMPIAPQTILAGATISVAGRLLSNQSIE
ncbi:MAG: CBM96 family carbohydrate-binding protein [Methanothrix sp.]